MDTLKYPLSWAGSHPEPLHSSTGQSSYICRHNQLHMLQPIVAAMSEAISSCHKVHNTTQTIAFLKAGAQPRARYKKVKTMSWQWANTGNSQQTRHSRIITTLMPDPSGIKYIEEVTCSCLCLGRSTHEMTASSVNRILGTLLPQSSVYCIIVSMVHSPMMVETTEYQISESSLASAELLILLLH